jgi:hypothetical protein
MAERLSAALFSGSGKPFRYAIQVTQPFDPDTRLTPKDQCLKSPGSLKQISTTLSALFRQAVERAKKGEL